MRSREQITRAMLVAARPTDSDKYPLRQLKAELLTVELLLDVRDLLQRLQPPTIISTDASIPTLDFNPRKK